MTCRTLAALAAFAVVAAGPAGAQSTDDPDKRVAGGGLPAGWHGRTDRANAKLADAKFVTMGKGYHVTSGPAAIYWHATHNVKAPYTMTATMTQTKAPAHPEAYGVFFMGSKLEAPDVSYAYVVVRGNGDMLVKHRAGADLHTIKDWAPSAAVQKQDASGRATNAFRVVGGPDSTRVYINGTPVFALASSYADPAGWVGLRVNHNLDVHIDEFTVTPGAATTGPAPSKQIPVKKG